MESRRPIRIQKKEEILRLRDTEETSQLNTKGHTPESNTAEHTAEITIDQDTPEEDRSDSTYETVVYRSDEQVPNKTTKKPRKRKDTEKSHTEKTKKKKDTAHTLFYFAIFVSIAAGYFLHRINSKLMKNIQIIENSTKEMRSKVEELEDLLHSKHKEVDVADYLEGARIIHDLTTESFYKKHWIKPVKGLSAEVAIDRVCTKHHCYSFRGSEGKLAIAFKNEKVIRKIGLLHPLYENRQSAIKRFTVDCLVNNDHVRVGEFEYEIPGDSFQQFTIRPTRCTGVIFRVVSNHGNKEYTCIYKVYAFE